MKWIVRMYVFAMVFLPGFAFAQNQAQKKDPPVLTNPLGETDPRLIIANLITAILSISGSLALLMFVYGGFLWMSSAGNPNQIDRGKKILLWATLGVVIIASAFAIVTALFTGLATGSVSP